MNIWHDDLPNPRLRAAPPSVPVLVDKRADAGLDARVARELHGVLHVPKRPQDEDVLGPVDPGAVLDCGPPAGDAALDLCTAPALELLRPIPAVGLDDGIGDGVDEVGARRHVMLPCPNAAPCCLDATPPSPSEAPSACLPRLRTAACQAHVPRRGTRDAPVPRVVERESSESRANVAATPTRAAEGARLSIPWWGNDGREGNRLAG